MVAMLAHWNKGLYYKRKYFYVNISTFIVPYEDPFLVHKLYV